MIENIVEVAAKLEELLLRLNDQSTEVIKAELEKTYPDLSDEDFRAALDYTVLKSARDLAGQRPR
jgi:hypothetical protein